MHTAVNPSRHVRENSSEQFFTTAVAIESLAAWLPDNSRLVKGPSAPSELHLSFFLYSPSLPLSPYFSSHQTPLLGVKVQLLGNSRELCLCAHEWEKSVKWSEAGKKEIQRESKVLCLGSRKCRKYIDRFCGLSFIVQVSNYSCSSLPRSTPNSFCPSLWWYNKKQVLFGTKIFLKHSLMKTNWHGRAQPRSVLSIWCAWVLVLIFILEPNVYMQIDKCGKSFQTLTHAQSWISAGEARVKTGLMLARR